MHIPFPITLENIAHHLATLADDDIIGECADAEQCLLARVLDRLYPEEAPWSVGTERYYDNQQRGYWLSPPLQAFINTFDMCQVPMRNDGRMPVTKAQLKSHLSKGLWHAYKRDLYDDLYATLL